ncbi:serine acetyltransferase [Ruminococcus sp. HUN007]|uniref:serine O-acetyltransferase n=1 Tax=Ruminococcus sp. HUN007 TaxID=1514668 RepID=UPI0005D1AD40|nr:serine acetyltransferase [Ruminococcus sp. HUN007]
MNAIEESISGIVNSFLADDEERRKTDDSKIFNHPDKDVIVEILTDLRKIIFPGYFRNRSIKVYTLRNNLSMLLEDVIYKLTKQISIVLGEEDNRSEEAEKLSLEFVGKLGKIREYIKTDVQAAYDGDPAAFSEDEIIYSYPGLFAVLVNRIAHELYLLGVPVIPRMMTEYAHSQTGIDIHPGASIGKYFFIDHGTGIVIGETTEIGDYVKIYQGVTLGALSTRGGQLLKSKKRHPTIEDNVTIYSGASILGGDTVIGKNVVIGGNAFITHSVSDGAKVSVKNQELRYKFDSANSVEKVESENDNEWFYII